MVALFKGFRNQFDDPDEFYTFLADDTIALIERYQPLTGMRVVDVGGGSGYFAEAFRRAEATSAFIEPEWDEMTEVGRKLGFGIVGDGCHLPLADGSFDVSFSSNVVEHVKDPWLFLDELVRVVRPGGLVFMAFTNWLSPFGGHETSPWHYVGGEWAAQRYEQKLGYPPKNRFGESLYELSIAKSCGGRDTIRAHGWSTLSRATTRTGQSPLCSCRNPGNRYVEPGRRAQAHRRRRTGASTFRWPCRSLTHPLRNRPYAINLGCRPRILVV